MKKPHWTKERVLEVIIDLHKKGEPLNSASVPSSLYQAGYKFFGAWEKAISGCGLDYGKIKLSGVSLSLEDIIQEIKRLHERGENLSASTMEEHKALEVRRVYIQASLKFDGGWDEALTKAGLNPVDIIKRRKPCTLRELSELMSEAEKLGLSLRATDVLKNPEYNRYYQVAIRRFDSWEEFLDKIGIDSSKYCNRTDWKNGKEVLAELKRLFSSGIVSGIRKTSASLNQAALEYFGGIKNASKEAGLIFSRSGKITKKLIGEYPNFYKVMYECNKDFVSGIAKTVYFWSRKRGMKTLPIEELNSEATVVFFDVLTKKPMEAGLRNFAYKPVFNALVKYNQQHFKETYIDDERVLDWLNNITDIEI